MQPKNLLVRCLARRDGGVWVASSIDFGLAAQGSTLEEARLKLHDQIRDYLVEAMTVDREHADVLLSRRATLSDQIVYWAAWAAQNRPHIRKGVAALIRALGISQRSAYQEPLPVCPA